MRRGIRTFSGFTLIEALITITLLIIVIAVGAPQMKEREVAAESKAVADIIGEEMRLARQKAVTKQIPVAIVFPSENGAKAHCQSYYILEGETNPKTTKVVDLSKTYPTAYIFNGWWDIDPNKLRDSTKTFTVAQPVTGSNYDTFDITKWGPSTPDPRAKDYAYLFTPGGTVKTNGLPLFDGEYHIVVSQAVAYEVASAPPSAMDDHGFILCFLAPTDLNEYCRLINACNPFTLNISPLGGITVTEGVTGVDSSVDNDPRNVAPPAPVVTPSSSLPDTININPSDVIITPVPKSMLPAGVDAQMKGDGVLGLTVKATGTNSNPLYIKWSAIKTAGAGTAVGSFSVQGNQPMEWSAGEGKWISTVEWRPPSGALPVGAAAGDKFRLSCFVSDKPDHGASASKVVQILGGKIAFQSSRDGNPEIYVMNEDGSGQTNLTNNPADDNYPCWSPDGKKIAFESNRDGNNEIYVMNEDGSGQTRLTNNSIVDIRPCWSPDGNEIAFERYGPPIWNIWKMNADGSGQTKLTNSVSLGTYNKKPSWSPRTPILFETNRDGNSEIYWMNTDGSAQTNLTNWSECEWWPSWSPDGSKILFCSNRDISHNYEVYNMNADGSGQINLTNSPVSNEDHPCWSPDGTKIAFISDRDGTWQIYVMNADGSVQTRLTNNSANDSNPSWSR